MNYTQIKKEIEAEHQRRREAIQDALYQLSLKELSIDQLNDNQEV